jgi:uncharacterized protein
MTMLNPFAHLELSTDNVQAARDFYGKVFRWKFQQLGPEMGNYVMIDLGSKTGAGGGMTGKMMPEQPTGWLPYVQVDSVMTTMAKAEAGGAKVMVPYQAIGEMGAIGIFVDPTGAAMGVWESAKRPAPKRQVKPAAKKKAKAKKRR